jgi:hypothetical protein
MPDPTAAVPAFAPFTAGLPFRLSDYQQAALEALSRPGISVVVVAPTGSGKSVIADAAVWQAQESGRAAAYTSPLKALANQRFAQLAERWGPRAGLLTGDRSVRPQAPARVMTAEVYRALALHEGLPLPSLLWAIFDEAHYLSDPERGSAWEEAILATPPETRILCLSATIGAPERLVGWLRWLGRGTVLVEATERPVPLRHYRSVRGDLHLVRNDHGGREERFPLAGGWALAQRRRDPARHGAGPAHRRRAAPIAGLPTIPPDQWVRQEALSALRLLRERGWTPTIAFTASRREAERLAEAARVLAPDDGGDADAVAYHHAGLHPRERRRVEERLRAGDLWLVCGTTTLAAGLDVPARSVLVTSFGRFDGQAFRLFSPAEYRQLTGRAGRLGKDDAGAAVLLPSPWHNFEEAFRALTAPLPPVTSAFRPGYPTALAWLGAAVAGEEGGTHLLARMLSRTFAAYLRRLKGGKQPPPLVEADGPSLLLARALARLLEADGLVSGAGAGTPAPRGRFVLDVGGAWEGRLLLRLCEAGAFDALDDEARAALLALGAEGPAGAPDEAAPPERALWEMVRTAHAAQVAAERAAGALITPPLPAGGPRSVDLWRRRQAAADLLERALRAARSSGVATGLETWGPDLLARLEAG